MNRIIPALPPLSHGCVGHEARNSSFVRVAGNYQGIWRIPGDVPSPRKYTASLRKAYRPSHRAMPAFSNPAAVRSVLRFATHVRDRAPDRRHHPMRVRGRAATARRSCHSPSSLSPFRLSCFVNAEEAADISRYRCRGITGLSHCDCPCASTCRHAYRFPV